MQSLATFFEDNKPLAYAATVAAIIVVIAVVYILYRLLFGRRLRTAVGGRARQPRLGIVDAFDLDRQRQLVLVRRDNVEHLIMIGGPTDVVIESAIVRTQAVSAARDKEATSPVLGMLPTASTSNGSLPIAAAPAPLAGAGSAARTEPLLGTPSPVPAAAERVVSRPQPAIDPVAPPLLDTSSPSPRAAPSPVRPTPMPPRPQATVPPTQPVSATPSPATPSPSTPSPALPAGTASGSTAIPPSTRPALPPRPLSRPPLPPRPSLASGLPPRPIRPLPSRTEPQIVNPLASPPPQPGQEAVSAVPRTTAPETDSATVVTPGLRPGLDPEPRTSGPETSQPVKGLDTLESLEEEMAKLLGRPTPRRED